MYYKNYSISTLNYLRTKYAKFYNSYNNDLKNINKDIKKLYNLSFKILLADDEYYKSPQYKTYTELILSLEERKRIIENKKIDLLQSIEDIEDILKTRGVIVNADF